MKVLEAIQEVDELKPNHYSKNQKIKWLSRLDAQIRKEIIDTHDGAPVEPFGGYDAHADQRTELIVPEPYDEVYLHWLSTQIDLNNAELDKFNNSNALFLAAYRAFANEYNRTHLPKRTDITYF